MKCDCLNHCGDDPRVERGEAQPCAHHPSRRPETNTEFVRRLMDFSPMGALSQIYILAALTYYTERCLEGSVGDTGFIHSDVWRRTARWFKDELDKRAQQEKPDQLRLFP